MSEIEGSSLFVVFNCVWVTSVAAETFVDTQTAREEEEEKRKKNCTIRNVTDHGWLKKDNKEGGRRKKREREKEREVKIRAPRPKSRVHK